MKSPISSFCFTLLALIVVGLSVPALQAQTTSDELESREGRWYERGSETPFTGQVEDPGEMAGRLEEGRRVGRWTGWHENERVAWVSDYEGGLMRYHAMYFPSGQMRYEGSFVNGRQDGLFKGWSSKGKLLSEAEYKQGQRHGTYKLWSESGKMLYSAEYAEGTLHGPAVWYFADGKKRWETAYADGKRDGVWTQWQQDGNIFMQSTWEAGELVSRNNPHAGHY